MTYTEKNIVEAADKFAGIDGSGCGALSQDRYETFIAGAKSEAAKEYWQKEMYTETQIKALYEDIRQERNYLRDEFEECTNPPVLISLKRSIKRFDKILSIFELWFKQNKKK